MTNPAERARPKTWPGSIELKRKNSGSGKRRAPKELDPLVDNIVSLLRGFEETKKQGSALGLFVDDRGLLECPRCGLEEDVASGARTLSPFRRIASGTPDCASLQTGARAGAGAVPSVADRLVQRYDNAENQEEERSPSGMVQAVSSLAGT